MDCRHEWKHEITPLDALVLRQRLGAVMAPDPHAKGGVYFVRSLYFDTPEDTALREKLDGVDRREKFRLRYYNLDPACIHLEKKSKRNGLCRKEQAGLTAAQARALIEGDTAWMKGEEAPLIRELYRKMTCRLIRPRTIVDYTREPFVYGPGQVRVTLDRDIRTGLACTDFLDPGCVTVPVPDGPVLLEVKWGPFLPDIIRDAVGLESRRASAYSKYAAARRYG